MTQIKETILGIQKELSEGVRLVAVSKTHPVELIREAYDCGVRDFGENKVQEVCAKQPQLPPDIRWHLIGHLQSNKVKYIASFVYMIHSVDSDKLLAVIDKEAAKVGKVVRCLLQVHVAQEETKFGFTLGELEEYFDSGVWRNYGNVKICGLMAMASNTTDESQVKSEFNSVHALFEKVKLKHFADADDFECLSMGMSGDYRIAVDCGATIVRVGSKIFGQRDYSKK